MLKINLGGTCSDSNWRDILIPMLKDEIQYINPVVENGTWIYNEKTKKELKCRNVII